MVRSQETLDFKLPVKSKAGGRGRFCRLWDDGPFVIFFFILNFMSPSASHCVYRSLSVNLSPFSQKLE